MMGKKKNQFQPNIAADAVSSNWINYLKSCKKKTTIKISVDKPRKPLRTKEHKQSKVMAIDCEMVSDENGQTMLARVSVVDFHLTCVYDKYVKPTSPVGDYRTKFSGIRPADIENGEDFDTVQKEVKELLHDKFLVGHSVIHDLNALKFNHHRHLIRDTSLYKPFREASDGKTPSLRKLAAVFLGETIQEGEHNSIQDALAAMKLYKKFRQEWEKSLQSPKIKTTVKNTKI